MTAQMLPLIVAAALAVAPAAQDPEPKPVPKGSVQIAANGCFEGRVFTATAPREETLPSAGPNVTGQHFRVTGKKDVMKLVKLIREKVYDKNQILLESEVQVW